MPTFGGPLASQWASPSGPPTPLPWCANSCENIPPLLFLYLLEHFEFLTETKFGPEISKSRRSFFDYFRFIQFSFINSCESILIDGDFY